ncbi:serine/threonine-protein phosphatase CPPED1-like [Oppia nitens]|uniref:serine/threonine-protein phosphatase CPPED1-like n=1 Tax=Oppia nitens TaxID=1686743 RepID=UPI0023D9F054|nr:serine/threonine-protein phosphatase CPPED1-like [Oppia nitens]
MQCFDNFKKNNKESQWTEPFVFIHSTDPQFGLIDRMAGKHVLKWDKEIQLTRDAIKAVNRMQPKPKFLVVGGDFVHSMPGNADRNQQMCDFQMCLDQLDKDIPLVFACGNHDVGDCPTNDTIDEYRRDFGDDYYWFTCGGVFSIVLNSQYYKDDTHVKDLTKKQDKWLDEVLDIYKQHNYKHLVVFQHIPYFLREVYEKDDRFKTCIKEDLRIKMLYKLHKSGARYVFSGHYHSNAGGMYKDLEQVVTSALGGQLGTDQSGLRVVKVYENSIQHQYYSVDEIPEIIQL